jgi:hypothetical protein
LGEGRPSGSRSARKIETVDTQANARPVGADFALITIQGLSSLARDGATRTKLRATAEAAMRAWLE